MEHPLKRYRREQKLTQEALGRLLNVSEITVSRWETGVRKIDPKLLPRVSGITGLRLNELRPDLAFLMSGAA